ncbi:hypothetical protein DV452_000623 [Geotrichum candidum]|nr:hypothetical protein DV452_000623 [Geotrichum candidum]
MEDQLEQAVNIAISGTSDASLKQQAIGYCTQVKESPDGWQVCLSLYTGSFKRSPESRFFALQVIDAALPRLSQEELQYVQSNLFTFVKTATTDTQLLGANYLKNKLAQTISFLFILSYQSTWTSFFDDFLSTLASSSSSIGNAAAVDIYLRILKVIHEEIGDNLILREPALTKRNNNIKDQIRDRDINKLTDSWIQILQNYIGSNEEIVEGVLKVIGGWVSWVDITLIINGTFVNLIYKCLQNEAVTLATCDTLIEVVSKKMKSLDKMELIRLLGLKEVISQLPADERVGKLANIVTLELVHILDGSTSIASNSSLQPEQLVQAEELLTEFFSIVTQYLGNEDVEISSQVLHAISEYLTFVRKESKQEKSKVDTTTMEKNLSDQVLNFPADSNFISPQRRLLLSSLLPKIILKMRYNDDDWEDEDFLELRGKLKLLQDQIASIDSDLYIDDIIAIVTNSFDPAAVTSWKDVELGLFELEAYSDSLKNGAINVIKGVETRPTQTLSSLFFKMIEKNLSLVKRILDPIFQDMEKSLESPVTPLTSLQIHHDLMAIGTFARGFHDYGSATSNNEDTPRPLDPWVFEQFNTATNVVTTTLERMGNFKVIRDAARFAIARLIPLLGMDILPKVTRLITCFLEQCSVEEMTDFLGFLGNLLHKFRKEEGMFVMFDMLMTPLFERFTQALNEGGASAAEGSTDAVILKRDLRRAYLQFIFNVLNNNMGAILFSDKNMSIYERVLQTVLLYASDIENGDDQAIKLAILVLNKMLQCWGMGVVKAEDFGANREVPGFEQFTLEHVSRICFEIPTNRSFNFKDSRFRGILGDLALLQYTIYEVRRDKYIQFLSNYFQNVGVPAEYAAEYLKQLSTPNLKAFKSFFLTLKEFLEATLDAEEINHRIKYLSSMPHLAGTSGDLALAQYVEDQFLSFGIKQVSLSEHAAYATYPNTTENALGLELVSGNVKAKFGNAGGNGENQQPQPFHSLSAPGDVTGPLIYVGRGEKADYERLKAAGIDVTGAVVVIHNGGPLSPGLKVHLAELNGAVGVVTFSENREVERNCVGIPEIIPGDALTPGYSSISSKRVLDMEDIEGLAKIPAIPASWHELKPFLKTLKGLGVKNSESDNELWSGNLKDSPKARLRNFPVIKPRHPIWNVRAKLEGLEQNDLAVIFGARRDSWCYGASSSAAGTAVMLEVARAFTLMAAKLKWAPLRSLYFASWDGHDENLAGTTEWVEYNANTLRQFGVVYVNLDAAITGDKLEVKGHPMLGPLMNDVLDETRKNYTVEWPDERIMPHDKSGDHSPFISYVGTVALDVGFKQEHDEENRRDGISYGGCSDTYENLARFKDRIPALADIVARLALHLSDDPIIPLDLGAYADALDEFADDLDQYAAMQEGWDKPQNDGSPAGKDVVSFALIREATEKIRNAYSSFTLWRDGWLTLVGTSGEAPAFMHFRWAWNARLVNIDKHLLDYKGIPGRRWFKHVVFGPQLWPPATNPNENSEEKRDDGDNNSDEGASAAQPKGPSLASKKRSFLWGTFPAARDAIERRDWNGAKEAVARAGAILLIAASKLAL